MNGPISKLARCAIYTRKSTEYNLELAFNSLDAQREACEAYIKSQAHEGWRLIPGRYDDGAFSGASLERPALQQLLADVRAGKLDIVLVYKVDRLTRSLADFAKLIELFDAHNVSFVSVTQSFNTSSSMRRLTLNVLLSFAQFERELIGERVRDKIAASKRKGLWVGGPVPLGYAAVDKKIVAVAAEAEAVRTIFARYLELSSIRALAEDIPDEDLLLDLLNTTPVVDGLPTDNLTDRVGSRHWQKAHGGRGTAFELTRVREARSVLQDVVRGDALFTRSRREVAPPEEGRFSALSLTSTTSTASE